MRFDFLSPELFNLLIYANLAVGLLLIIGRFTMDMRRKPPVREQSYDESSYSHLSDTDANPALARESNDTQDKNNQRSSKP